MDINQRHQKLLASSSEHSDLQEQVDDRNDCRIRRNREHKSVINTNDFNDTEPFNQTHNSTSNFAERSNYINGNDTLDKTIVHRKNKCSNAIEKKSRKLPNYDSEEETVSRSETTRIEKRRHKYKSYESEIDSYVSFGGKKQNANHLLNFVYRTPAASSRQYPRKDGIWQREYEHTTTNVHKYNKEHFLQANCQFVVRDNNDYSRYINNPDILVEWELIEQINIRVNELPSCPICLYSPMAAKMTRCGHIYCWSCMLHYLSLTDKSWRKCPICFDAVHKKDLKTVFIDGPRISYTVKDIIPLKLMKRPKNALMVYPVLTDISQFSNNIPHITDILSENVYSKLLLANVEEIRSAIISREYQDLQIQKHEMCGAPESCFIEQALSLLKEREDTLCTTMIEVIQNNAGDEPLFNSNDSSTFALDSLCRNLNKSLTVTSAQNQIINNCTTDHIEYYYFYQAADGQHIYLHGLNARMLEHSYGCLQKAPPTLNAVILEKTTTTINQTTRRRLRYLEHLPLTCQFDIIEIQLGVPLVTNEVLAIFKDQLEERSQHRLRRANDEKLHELRVTDAENRIYHTYDMSITTADINLKSHEQFPEFDGRRTGRSESESSAPENISHYSNSESLATVLGATSSSLSSSSSTASNASSEPLDCGNSKPLSFAKMVQMNRTMINKEDGTLRSNRRRRDNRARWSNDNDEHWLSAHGWPSIVSKKTVPVSGAGINSPLDSVAYVSRKSEPEVETDDPHLSKARIDSSNLLNDQICRALEYADSSSAKVSYKHKKLAVKADRRARSRTLRSQLQDV